jgi:DNA-binding NtrC family response regulator/nitrogen-specific signal transduction histidine kinase
VDDEPANRKLLRVLVEHEGLVPVEACGGQEALDLLSQEEFDLVLLDMMMPVVGGMAVLQRLHDSGTIPGLPVVVVTALTERALRVQALELGAMDFASKPVDVLELRCRLRTLLELGKLRDRATKEAAVQAEASLQARIDEAIGDLPLVLYQNPGLGTEEFGQRTVGDLERLTGHQGDVSFQELWADAVHPEDRARLSETYRDLVEGTSTEWHVQYRWNSNKKWVIHVGKFDPKSGSLVGALLDINETKQLEAKYLQSQKMEAVGQLAGGIAHDFNNLLCAIISFTGFAREGLPADDQRSADMGEVLKAAERAAGLTRQLLTFSRRKKSVKEAIDLNDRLAQMHRLLTRTLGEQISLKVSPSPRPAIVEIDPIQFDQVILNLAVNARDAMPDGGSLYINLVPEYATDGPVDELVRLTVRDTGKGMDPQTCLRVFEPFFTTKEKGRGTGLGLATCFAIVEQAGGTIAVESVESKGSTFTIRWPSSSRSEHVQNVDQRAIRSGLGHEILVVEDEASIRRVMKRVLEGAGYQVYTAVDGEEAKCKVDMLGDRLSAIVTDIVMPKVGGFELATYVRTSHPGIAIIFVTGYMDDKVNQVDLKTAKLVWKPFQRDDLLRVVGESVGTAKPSRSRTKKGNSALKSTADALKKMVPEAPQPAKLNGSRFSGKRSEVECVLFVDDDEALCRAGVRALQPEGFEVIAKTTLEAARKALETQTFAAIVLDVLLPDGNGLDLLEQTGSTPVIVVTGAPSGESAKRAVQGRVFAFLPKPLRSEELCARVREAVDEGRLSAIRSKLLASRHGGNEFIEDLRGTEELFEKALASLYMVYQPIVRGEDHSIYGYEALLRCAEPRLQSPLKLLAVAEILGRVEDIGRAVRSSVASTMQIHRERLEAIFVNLHPRELDSGLLGDSMDPLFSLAPRVILEITERASLQSGARLSEELNRAREIGYRVAVDDLGEGYAGLTSLVLLQPDIVKIDMSLIRNLHQAPLQIDIVDAIIDMAHRSGIVVVGEGVEIKEERDVLVALGCDLLQGYYIGRPAEPFSTVNKELLKERK